MGKKNLVPDAWDDDWESQADKADDAVAVVAVEEQVKISKAERLAQHAESNKKLWESASVPNCFTKFYKGDALLTKGLGRRQNHFTFLQPATMSP